MTPITSIVASEHIADLRRAADLSRVGTDDKLPCEPATHNQTIALRFAGIDETALVQHLAALDSAGALEGRVLLAVADGEPIAALSLEDGRVAANPFRCTADAVALLRVREQHLRGARSSRGWRAFLHPRLAIH